MATITTTELPYHRAPEGHITENSSTFNLSKKTILNLLNTKCTTSFENLKQVHALTLKTGQFQDHFVLGTLVKCYAIPQFGSFVCSIKVLDQISNPNVFVWNCMLKGCLDNEEPLRAILFYHRMVVSNCRTNKFTYPPLLKACTIEQAVQEGRQIHAHVVKNRLLADDHIKSSGIRMYASFGCLQDARNIFDADGELDVICCNAMIDCYMKRGEVEAAKELFQSMESKDVGTWNTMINGFSINGMIGSAKDLFNKMQEKDEISWNVMIDGCNKQGYFKEALEVFGEMQREEQTKLRKCILSIALATCANIGALDEGKEIHGYLKKNSVPVDAVLETSLVDMYSKCGRLDLAWEVFENMKNQKIFSWNAMIGGLAMRGRAKDAIELFSKMQREKFRPNHDTFVAILIACAHAGLVDKGMNCFNNMKQVYGVEPRVEHYVSVVDLLGRAGLLTEADEFISSMPIKPNSAVFRVLLGACRVHQNLELAEKVGKVLLEMEPENTDLYILLSNIYAKSGRFDEAAKVRKLMKEREAQIIAGKSMISLDGVVHEFKMGEETHPQIKDIYIMLEKIMDRIRFEGHLLSTSGDLFDIGEDEEETSLKYHNEKLAIAFGLMNTAPGATIRVMKNLRVCEDCHIAAKLISKIYNREIIVRDCVRFHHFKNGKCSCDDFW